MPLRAGRSRDQDNVRRLVVGCGYLGKRVARLWRDAGDEVYATTRGERADTLSQAGLQPLTLDVTQKLPPVPIGERHFRRAVTEYVAHYHRERNHQGLNNRLTMGTPVIKMTTRVRRHPRLGGLLNFYERAA